ncbi:hypothetical protein R5R35_012418 [Gryllus longicercus]|uniref:CUB domain-containing protein n=1 Tax=Gryllus longicercus TaxID=2509291 RepID=A0AAN9Z4W2_9ORTH
MLWLLVVCSVVAVSGFDVYEDNHPNALGKSSKFFPFFTVVRISNNPCVGENNLNGTCYSRRVCASYDGIASGSCGGGLGVCCIIQRTCGGTSNLNCTYFINPNYPSSYAGGTRCSLTINKCNTNICQVRLDFLEFSLASPDFNGVCATDFFTVTGGSSIVPRICGENTGQHIYVDFDEGAVPIQLSVDTTASVAFGRRWNIKVMQIPCDSPSRAPVGCLMYYTETTGTVKSFNFGTAANPSPGPFVGVAGTRELANLNYGVCVRMNPGYCAIEWSADPNNNFSFTVTDNTIPANSQPDFGQSCTTDFVVIPNPQQNGVSVPYDRFCGSGFITTTTFSKPFVLTVVTDGGELGNGTSPDLGNRGFCLLYRQIPCPP